MTQWLIRKVKPQEISSTPGTSESWPPASVFTVQNMMTGEIRNVTCRGAGLLDGLIAAGRFDKEDAA